MTRSNHNSSQNNDDHRKFNPKRRKIEPARKAPQTERGLTHSPYFNGPLYERMSEDLHLGGMSKRTHEGYLRAVRQLADFCKCPPDQMTEDQLRKLFLHLKNNKEFASGSLRVAFSGVKFFYTRNWQTLAQMKIQNVKSLPEVLTINRAIGSLTAAPHKGCPSSSGSNRRRRPVGRMKAWRAVVKHGLACDWKKLSICMWATSIQNE